MFLKDKPKDIGVNLNVSFVGNDVDGYTAGAHITTSDGIDVSAEAKGDSPNGIANALTVNLIQAVFASEKEKQRQAEKDAAEKKKMARAEKRMKMDELYNQLDALYDELDRMEEDMENEDEDDTLKTSAPIDDDSHISLDDLFGSDKDDFFDYLDSLLK